MTPDEILAQAAKTFKERNAVYKSNYTQMGPLLAALFPEGITLKTELDFVRFHLLMLVMVKATRYVQNWEAGHQDSLRDAAVYFAMLESVDNDLPPKQS